MFLCSASQAWLIQSKREGGLYLASPGMLTFSELASVAELKNSSKVPCQPFLCSRHTQLSLGPSCRSLGCWTSPLSLPCADGKREKMSLLWSWCTGVEELDEGWRDIWGVPGWAGRWVASWFTDKSWIRALAFLLPETLQKSPLLLVSLSYIMICESFVVCPFPGTMP